MSIPLHTAWRSRQDGKALQWFVEELNKAEVTGVLTEGL